jgi:hypothetical protein
MPMLQWDAVLLPLVATCQQCLPPMVASQLLLLLLLLILVWHWSCLLPLLARLPTYRRAIERYHGVQIRRLNVLLAVSLL